MYSDVGSLVDGALVSATPHCSSGTVYQSSLLRLYSVVSNSSFRDMMCLAAIICCSGYQNDVKKGKEVGFTLSQATKALRESKGIALGTRRG
jgi:hypothetical protein